VAGILIAAFEFARVLAGGEACDLVARTLPWSGYVRAGADVPLPAGDMAMPVTHELHFQEGFSGQTVEVLVDGTEVARFEARTRMQIGLAHIERLDLSPGDVVTVRIGDGATSASITAESGKTYFNINLKDHKLIMDSTESSPGYM
jgi:hypothetical protein